MAGEQFKLYTHDGGPNGWKVAIVLELLGLSYESIYLDMHKGEHKAPEFTKYNPNGRIPALIDSKNNDLVIWESCAIIEYLVDTYDTEHKFSAKVGTPEKYIELQWLFFQASGQGTYFGQFFWFAFLHPGEKIPSAIERYKSEIKRVAGVLDGVLKDKEWLMGGSGPTVADTAFVNWDESITTVLGGEVDWEKEYPSFWRWHQKVKEIPAVKKVLEIQASMTKH